MTNLVALGEAVIGGMLAIVGFFYILRCHRRIHPIPAENDPNEMVFTSLAAIRGVLAIAGVFHILRCRCTIPAENDPNEIKMGNLSSATPGVNAKMNNPAAKHHLSPSGQCLGLPWNRSRTIWILKSQFWFRRQMSMLWRTIRTLITVNRQVGEIWQQKIHYFNSFSNNFQ